MSGHLRSPAVIPLSTWSGQVLSCPVSSVVGQGDLLVRQVDLAGVPDRYGGRRAMPERAEGLGSESVAGWRARTAA